MVRSSTPSPHDDIIELQDSQQLTRRYITGLPRLHNNLRRRPLRPHLPRRHNWLRANRLYPLHRRWLICWRSVPLESAPPTQQPALRRGDWSARFDGACGLFCASCVETEEARAYCA